MADIAIDRDVHGLAGVRHYTFEPTFIIRGLTALHVTFVSVR